MDDYLKKEILNVLIPSYKAVRRNNLYDLRALSDHLLHSSSIFQDKYTISIAIVTYSLFKIMEKNESRAYKNWNGFYKEVKVLLYLSIVNLKRNNFKEFETCIKKIMQEMKKLDIDVGMFVQEIIDSSKIKKGGKLYEHGLSAGRVAELLGISQWDLMQYIGVKKEEYHFANIPIKERLNFTRRIFNLK